MNKRLTVASLIVYGLSLASPTFTFALESNYSNADTDVWNGFSVLLSGWLGMLFLQFGWTANPWYYLSLCFFWTGRWRAAATAGGITLFLAANTLLLFRQTLSIPADHGISDRLNLQRLEIGFYFWAIALLIPGVWSLIQFRRSAQGKLSG